MQETTTFCFRKGLVSDISIHVPYAGNNEYASYIKDNMLAISMHVPYAGNDLSNR